MQARIHLLPRWPGVKHFRAEIPTLPVDEENYDTTGGRKVGGYRARGASDRM